MLLGLAYGRYGPYRWFGAAELHPSPVPYAHIHDNNNPETLRGPRGGFVLTNDEDLAKKINSAIFWYSRRSFGARYRC